ncbi:MAG: UDP-N-acetyl-D-glucosamine dehydrogenase [Pseudonocardiales bacterium]|jgi:UDP-N-acetyl-D-glucosamine dehydrogenase|nr:UDP-N-acetyl-D-glucosamine dehydrogenase [Pseudonocardiales bacterium]
MRGLARLQRSVDTATCRVCVIGQGYVGLSVAAAAAIAGMRVDGVDVDAERVAGLSQGRNVVPGVADSLVSLAVDTGRIHFSTDAAIAAEADVVIICVPTPLVDHQPDLSAIESAGRQLATLLKPGSLVVLESTTYPGTTESVLRPLLETGGRRCGRDFLLAYSPERIDPGNVKFGLRNTPRVVGGVTPEATDVAATFYRHIVDDVETLSSCRAAEMAKLLENTFRMVNIALVNELAMLCATQDIDVWEVVRAAATKPFGFMPFYPGPGVGGHCIPLDPTYLSWQTRRDTGRRFHLVEMAQDINEQMPSYVADRVVEALNDQGKSVKGARIFALGVTYKANVGDMRESASLQVLAALHKRGAKVTFHDPYVASVSTKDMRLRRSALTDRALGDADCVLLLTPHSVYDPATLVDRAELLFDAQNAIPSRTAPSVVRL